MQPPPTSACVIACRTGPVQWWHQDLAEALIKNDDLGFQNEANSDGSCWRVGANQIVTAGHMAQARWGIWLDPAGRGAGDAGWWGSYRAHWYVDRDQDAGSPKDVALYELATIPDSLIVLPLAPDDPAMGESVRVYGTNDNWAPEEADSIVLGRLPGGLLFLRHASIIDPMGGDSGSPVLTFSVPRNRWEVGAMVIATGWWDPDGQGPQPRQDAVACVPASIIREFLVSTRAVWT